ncbi:MAG: PAS domain-containing protein [Rhodospirillaceae bacterium]|nr:PAS domain-containing protein [Rhodospirillaceae bacterium]
MAGIRADNYNSGARALRLAEASLDASREPLFRFGVDGGISYVNDSACRALGYSREELLTLTVSDINPEFPPAKFAAAWESLRETGAVEVEGRQRRKDGSEYPVRLSIRHIEIDGEEFAIASVRDIPTDEEVHQALAQSEARLRSVRREAGIGFAEWATGSDELVWDEETFRIFGYEPGSIIPTYELVLSLVVSEDRPHFEEAEHHFSESSELGVEVEYRIIAGDGGLRHIREEMAVTRDKKGDPIFVTAMVHDITEAKQAEMELRESEARLNEAQRLARMGEWYVDLGEEKLTYSDQVYEILGVSRETYEPSRERYVSFVHPEDKQKFLGEVRDKTYVGEAVGHDHRIIRPDGKILHVEQHNEPIFDAAGKIIARRGTIQDITARKENEERLNEAQRMARMGEWSLDLVTEKLTYSDQVYDLLGISKDDFTPTPDHFEGLVHPDDKEWFQKHVKDRVYEAEILTYDHRIVRADGQILYMEQRNEPVLDDAGKVIARRGTIQDITESKLATLALQESEARLREAQRIARLGEWYRDLASNQLTYSDEIYEILGETRENFTPSPEALVALIHPDDRDFFQHIAQKKIIEPAPFTYSHRIIRPDGETIHVEQRSEPVLGDDGKVIARRGTLQDITPLKQATLALQKSEAEFAQAQAIAHVGSWYRDLVADELTYSDEMFQILGVKKEEFDVAPQSFMAMVHPDDRDHVYNTSQRDLEAAHTFDYEHRIVRPDGTVRYIDHHSAPIFDEAGMVIARRGTMQDITARKEAEIALELAQRSLDASHELILRCAPDGRILYANPAACRSLGYSAAELLKLSVPDMNADIKPDVLQEQWRELREVGVLNLESRHRRKDGSIYPVNATVSYVKHGGKEYSYVSARDITAEKEAEDKLRELDERFSRARQYAGFGTWEWRPANGKITWSEETHAIFGLSVDMPEPNFAGFMALVHPEDREYVENFLAERNERSGEYEFEYRVVWPDGELRFLNERGTVTKDDDGEILYVTGTVQDITNEKRAEQHLKQVEQRFSLARRQARIGTWEWNIETNSVDWSDDTALIYGHEPGSLEPTYEYFENLVHPEDRAALHAAERKAFESAGENYEAEYRMRLPDGEIRHIYDIGVVTRDESGKAIYMTGIIQDISERKRAEQAIRESERHYRSLFESSLDGIMIADTEGRIEDANPAVLEMLGYDIETLRGMTVDEITPPKWRALTRDIRAQIQHIPQGEYEKEYFRRDGSTVPVTLHVWPIGGQGDRVMGIIRDVTESKRIEEQLRQAQKMEAVGQLTGGIAHDFNNLLTVVMGNLEMVSDNLAPESDAFEMILRAYRAAGRGANLTHQLLAFSRKQTLLPTAIEPGQLITDMSDMLRVSLDEAVELSILSNRGMWLCKADKAQLENTILNLTINARDAMPDGGTLTIKTENAVLDDDYVASHEDAEAGEYVMFAISDTGSGISPDVLDHVFEPFFTTKEVGAGSGLGLSMIYGFARQSGGHVTIESEVGKGTVVKHYLPRWVPDSGEASPV